MYFMIFAVLVIVLITISVKVNPKTEKKLVLCPICKTYKSPTLSFMSTSDNIKVCVSCLKKSGFVSIKDMERVKNLTFDDIKSRNTNIETSSIDFNPDIKAPYLWIDTKKKTFKISNSDEKGKKFDFTISHSFEDLLSYSIGDRTVISKHAKSGAGRAFLGTLIAPGVGTVIGGLSGRKGAETTQYADLTIYVRGERDNVIILRGLAPNIARQVSATLDIIVKSNDSIEVTTEKTPDVSIADELIKLKSLLDSGVLTQEEFDIQKDKILLK